MSNTLPTKVIVRSTSTSSVHVIITAILGMIVTGLCCYAFYVFRTGSLREQSFTDAMKAIRAATEIVASMAERGLPAIRGRLDEVESRGRALERRMAERLSSDGGSGSTVTATEQITSEAAMLAARKAARAQQS